MKIGTDGVLLSAWASLKHNPNSILDIGSGTGIIALMLAQRSYAGLIDALEIDEDAYEQSSENFENSEWSDRLFCYHASFDEFVKEMQDEEYDLIISNPPFYAEDHFSENSQRNQARFQKALPFGELLDGVAKLLSKNGKFNVIIPLIEEQNFLEIAEANNLYPSRITRVKGNPEVPPKRTLLELGFQKGHFEPEFLTIETSRHHYTPEYIALTKDFYLKM
ncbi:MAG TPA: methyltransferase [Salinimicrobium sp.]|nr:methyltransferase [Salinimicrobium sp.]